MPASCSSCCSFSVSAAEPIAIASTRLGTAAMGGGAGRWAAGAAATTVGWDRVRGAGVAAAVVSGGWNGLGSGWAFNGLLG